MQVKAQQEQQQAYREYMEEQRRRQENPFYGEAGQCGSTRCAARLQAGWLLPAGHAAQLRRSVGWEQWRLRLCHPPSAGES